MARLTRKNIKVFAENATNNGIFGSLQANDPTTTNDVEQIQSLPAWSNGWDDATMTSEELPPLEEFQGIQYVVSYEQAYLMQEGLPEWSTLVTYFKGSLVKNITPTGFQIYNSLTDNNTGNLLSDTSNWKLVMDSDNLYALDNTVVHNTGAETVAGVKTFSSSPVVPNGSGSTDAVNKGQLDTKANTTDVVNLTGAQTVSGTKTFTGGINVNNSSVSVNTGIINLKEGGVYNNGSPSTNQRFGTTHYVDSSGILRGYTHNYQNTSGDVVTELRATNTVYGSSLLVGVSQSGVRYVQAPASDVVDSVVTTINKSKSANGYFKLGNGLIIQWGYSTIDGAQVTLPTPFSSTNYRICATYMRSSGNIGSGSGHLCTYPTSTTSFYANTEAGEYQWIAIGY